MQGCQKNSHQFNRDLIRQLIRRFFIDIFCLGRRVELYKLSHEKVQKRELLPKFAEKLKFLMRFVEIFDKYFTPRVLKEIVEKRLWRKIDVISGFYEKNNKNYVFLERTL